MKKTMWFGMFALLGCLAGCEGSDVPIGDDEDDETTSQASPLLASWKGYVELYELRSGSDAITIDIDAVNGTEITGRVTFGAGPALAPPASAEAGYPENASFEGDPRAPFEGFGFTIKDSRLIDGERLQFSINTRELWSGWCEMQPTTYPAGYAEGTDDPIAWGCEDRSTLGVDEDGGCTKVDPGTGETVPVDCWKVELCGYRVCQCDADGCTSSEEDPYAAAFVLSFDIQMTEEHGDGSLVGLESGGAPRNVRVNKVD